MTLVTRRLDHPLNTESKKLKIVPFPTIYLDFYIHFVILQGEPGSGDVKNAVLAAIDAGYRHIDTAEVYQTEGDIGEAIKEKINSGDIKREELFITTKVRVTSVTNV
jgi:Aldo/keto reductases, related to diketogulonate reductase